MGEGPTGQVSALYFRVSFHWQRMAACANFEPFRLLREKCRWTAIYIYIYHQPYEHRCGPRSCSRPGGAVHCAEKSLFGHPL